MKSFKEYLTESKKIYEFKVKIVGECPKDCAAQIKAALAQFHVGAVSEGKRTPVQVHHSEFPEHKNLSMSVYDVTLDYPTTSPQVRDLIASAFGKSLSEVKAMTVAEVAEHDLNHANDKRSGVNVGGTEQEPSNHSNLASENQKMSFLADLSKEPRHTGTQYTGVNDAILSDSVPGIAKEYRKTKQTTVEKAHASPVGTRQIKFQSQ
jgi:hypothetical protein